MTSPRWQHLLLVLAFLSLALAASPTSFCKCTCFTNSTIIPLDDSSRGGSSSSSSSSGGRSGGDSQDRVKTRTCADCNKQFCLDYNLPICGGATEQDVFTTCFQRDSTKDEAVVFIFILATVGLLAWAAVKPWFQRWRDSGRVRQSYAPVGDPEGDG